jgi:signal transduction histidine kinase
MPLPNLHEPEAHGRQRKETPIRFPTRFSSGLPFILPFLFFAAAFPAWPQNSQPTQSTEPLKELSLEQLGNIEVTTASKEQVEVWQTPAAIYVITQDDIQRSGARSIPEVLRLAPGVEIARTDDNGSGIAPEDRKKIFEPFYTTKKDVGTGLGLWLTLDLAGKHRGSICLRSSTRHGRTWTAFSVFLPERPPGN